MNADELAVLDMFGDGCPNDQLPILAEEIKPWPPSSDCSSS